MMSKIEKLRSKVNQVYELRNENRDEWADWFYQHHIGLVAEVARKLAHRYGADSEISEAAALLHDIADAVMSRDDLRHEQESLRLAREFLKESGYNDREITIVIEDALKLHSCRDNKKPQTLEGKIMAAADGIVHLQSDFYDFTWREKSKDEPLGEIVKWANEKIERDFKSKIPFPDLRDEVKADYERLRERFSRLG